MDGSRQHHDVIVVGSGPGGATVARELSRRGRSVLILEWGPGRPVRGTVGQYFSEQLVPGKSLLITPGLVGMVRGITTGGSSVFYYATAFPVPFEMLEKYGVELRDDVAEARRELPIDPLPEEMLTPMAGRIMEAATGLGFDWRPLDKLIDQHRWRPGQPFGYYGDPHHAKWTARAFVDEAVASGATLVNHARVTRVLVSDGTATGVEYRRHGRRHRLSADTVVLAAGGIGSAVILRASGVREAGTDFFFDPLLTVCGTVRDVSTRPDEIPMSAGVHLAGEGYMMTDMAVPRLPHAAFAAQVGRIDKLAGFTSTARIMVKARDRLGGRITDRGGVRKRLHPVDRDTLRRGARTARRILEAMGATGIYRTWYFAAHPGGTAKLGHVVDSSLRTRYPGLYVCDCSVIPEAWGLPPTLTIIGLGKYLARHLLGPQAEHPPRGAENLGPRTSRESLGAGDGCQDREPEPGRTRVRGD